MRAQIEELWDTGRRIVAYEGDEFDRPQSIADIRKCSNVLVGDKYKEIGATEVMIDDIIIYVKSAKYRHPAGGSMYVLEII